jgi:prepilin-type N-terminal cleavage/methylation domain-containing protein/prepilin-type processing-associated H-X9-DG protein
MRLKKSGFTLVELLTVIAVIAVLASFLLPSLARAKASAQRIKCLNNLKQMVTGSIMYSEDCASASYTADSFGADGERWGSDSDVNYLHKSYVATLSTFLCPSAKNIITTNTIADESGAEMLIDLMDCGAMSPFKRGTSYLTLGLMAHDVRKTQNSVLTHARINDPIGMVAGPAQIWLHTDQNPNIRSLRLSLDKSDNHGPSGANVSFCDGHVSWVNQSTYTSSYDFSQDDRCADCWLPDNP